jgi:hypothetical protein
MTRPSKPITASPPTLFFSTRPTNMPSRVFRDIRTPWSIALPWELPAPFDELAAVRQQQHFRLRGQVSHSGSSVEHEVANRVIAEVSYSFVHGQNLIRARDMNHQRAVSGFRFLRRKLARLWLGGNFLHLAVQHQPDLPISSVHQSPCPPYSATRCNQRVRERRL